MDHPMRTHDAGNMNLSLEGKPVRVAGWVHSRRDHGGLYFFDLRDRSGLVQVAVHPEKAEAFLTAAKLGAEYVVSVAGTIQKRPAGTENTKIPSGHANCACHPAPAICTMKPTATPPSSARLDALNALNSARK